MINNHLPVLLSETISLLNIKANGIYVDCTAGRGGHTSLILEKLNNKGKLICVDLDQSAIDFLSQKFSDYKNIFIVKDNFKNIKQILTSLNIKNVDGLIADLGVSSPMFDDASRGFSYHANAKLDMRMDLNQDKSAYEIINLYSDKKLLEIFRKYGEIKNPKNVVNAILQARKTNPIVSTDQLVDIIKKSINKKELFKSKHPARLYFQALRIETNDELNNLNTFLMNVKDLLKKDGRLIIITFHSLEDRIVKHFFNNIIITHLPKEVPIMNQKTDYELLTKKPIISSELEIKNNYRSRSAKLRAIRRTN